MINRGVRTTFWQLAVRQFTSRASLRNQSKKELDQLTQNLRRSSGMQSRPGSVGGDFQKEVDLQRIIALSSMGQVHAPKKHVDVDIVKLAENKVQLDRNEELIEELIESKNGIEKTDEKLSKPSSEESNLARNSSSSSSESETSDIYTSKVDAAIKLENPGLPSDLEALRSNMAKRLEVYFDSIQDTIFTASRTLNDVTGYLAIERLKLNIDTLEKELADSRDDVKIKKELYSQAINERSQLQKDINELLTRKHEWTSNDLERFTSLYRSDHANEQGELAAQEALDEAEKKVDAIQLKLTRLILTRYHEEQIWSDKIRKALTWGTWILMGINIWLFIIATFLVEPWKRKKLVSAFELKVKDLLQDYEDKQLKSRAEFWNVDPPLVQPSIVAEPQPQAPVDVIEKTATIAVSPAVSIWDNIKGNYSRFIAPDTNYIQISKFDVSLVVAASALLGVVLGSLVGSLLR